MFYLAHLFLFSLQTPTTTATITQASKKRTDTFLKLKDDSLDHKEMQKRTVGRKTEKDRSLSQNLSVEQNESTLSGAIIEQDQQEKVIRCLK